MRRLAIAFGVVLASLGGSGTAGTSHAGSIASVALPVIRCPTTVAISTQPRPKRLPKSIRVKVPRSLARSLGVYSDTQKMVMSVAPRGWACEATFGADASGGLIIHPRDERVPLRTWDAGWRLSHGSHAEAITVLESGASPTQAAGLACSYFSSAAKQSMAAFGHRCPSPPRTERVTVLNAHAVRFDDPGEAHGGGIPSGGRDPAAGAVVYSSTAIPGMYETTCVLPSTQVTTCAAATDYFLTLHRA